MKDGEIIGTVVMRSDGNYIVTPKEGYVGELPVITYTVSDGKDSAQSTLTVTNENQENQPPVAKPDTDTATTEAPATGNVLTNDTDPDNGPASSLSVTKVSVGGVETEVPVNGLPVSVNLIQDGEVVGTLEIQSDGTYTVTPKDGYTGELPVVDYTISDGEDTAVSTLTVTNENVEKDGHLVIGTNSTDMINIDPTAVDGPSSTITVGASTTTTTTNQNDVVVGDKGGSNAIVTPGSNYNAVILLDITRSMGNGSNGDVWNPTKNAVKELMSQLASHDGVVNFELVVFSQTAAVVGHYTNFTATDAAALNRILDSWTDPNTAMANAGVYNGTTSYSSAFNKANAFFTDAMSDGATQNYENVTYFISDGDPSADVPATAFAAYDPVAAVSKVHAIGITGTVNSPLEKTSSGDNRAHILDYFDNTPSDGGEATVPDSSLVDFPNWRPAAMEGHAAGEATLLVGNNTDELNTALQTGGTEVVTYNGDADTINAGSGNDVIFGDTIDTNSFSWNQTEEAAFNYIHENWKELLADTNSGGNDTIDAGAGNDVIIGGGGNDTLTGGDGADLFVYNTQGANGNDTIVDFTADDRLVFVGVSSAEVFKSENQAQWDANSHTLTFKSGANQEYSNSITIEGSTASTIDELLANSTNFIA